MNSSVAFVLASFYAFVLEDEKSFHGLGRCWDRLEID